MPFDVNGVEKFLDTNAHNTSTQEACKGEPQLTVEMKNTEL